MFPVICPSARAFIDKPLLSRDADKKGDPSGLDSTNNSSSSAIQLQLQSPIQQITPGFSSRYIFEAVMALAPKFAGHRLVPGIAATGADPHSVHTLSLYLDFVCPYSKKLFNRVYNDIAPLIAEKYPGRVQIIFRQQIQPWHPSSTLTHEAALAVLKTKPEAFWPAADAIFVRQKEFFDASVVNETRNQTYRRLAQVVGGVVSEDVIMDMLKIADKPGEGGALNSGNKVTDDLKVLVKAARLVGVHVSPTVIFNGIVENSISSGWTVEQWEEWLKKNIV